MDKPVEYKKIEDKIKNEAVSIAEDLTKMANTIGQIEINKFKLINSENPDPIKVTELETTKNTLIIDAIELRRKFTEKVKEGLVGLGIDSREAEKYSINLQTGEIRKNS